MSELIEDCDWLTGLKNLKWAKKKLKTLVESSSQVALILVDVDGMKHLNDCMGFPQADDDLISVSYQIEDSCDASAGVFRYGGDEFGVILDEHSVEQARELAQTICLNHQPVPMGTYKGEKIHVLTLSLGISHFPTHVSDSGALFKAAELALFKAKNGGRLSDGTPYIGRNRVMAIGDFFDEFPEQSAEFLKKPE